MRKSSTTWIAALNSSELKIFKYKGPNEDLELLEDIKFEKPHKLSQDLVSSKQGRVFHSADQSRSAMERPTDPHEQAKLEALQKSVQYLEEKANAFDRLILAAAPEILGNLRNLWSNCLKAKQVDELSKDLTHLHIKDMPSHLEDVLNIKKHSFQPHFTARR